METLRDLRKSAGKTARKVAKEINVSINTVFRYETGKRTLPIELVPTLAKMYNEDYETIVRCAINSKNISPSN